MGPDLASAAYAYVIADRDVSLAIDQRLFTDPGVMSNMDCGTIILACYSDMFVDLGVIPDNQRANVIELDTVANHDPIADRYDPWWYPESNAAYDDPFPDSHSSESHHEAFQHAAKHPHCVSEKAKHRVRFRAYSAGRHVRGSDLCLRFAA